MTTERLNQIKDIVKEKQSSNPTSCGIITELVAEIERLHKVKKEVTFSHEAIEIYELYPRKTCRPAGLKAIEKALKTNSADFIKKSVAVFAKKVAGKSKEFIPHPASWFNAERYKDKENQPPKWVNPLAEYYDLPENDADPHDTTDMRNYNVYMP